MPAPLQAPLLAIAWILVVLLLSVGFWFLRRHRLLHVTLAVILVLIGLFLLIRLRELLLMLLLAGVIAFVLDALVERLAQFRFISRPVAIAVVYLSLFTVLILIGTLVIPQIVRQARLLVQNLPLYVERAKLYSAGLSQWYGGAPEQVQNAIDTAIEQLQAASRAVTGDVEHALVAVLGWTVRGILVLVMSIYLLTDKRHLRTGFLRLVRPDLRSEAEGTMQELSVTFSRYLRGQLTVILFVAISVTVVLLLFGIPYPFFIGFMAGVLEVIPYFGAVAGAVPAVALGFLKSPTVGVSLIVFFILINQIEGHVVIPLVMGGHLEMRPLTILLALIAGERLFGIAGMIIAIPAVSMIRVLIPPVRKFYHHLRAHERPPGEAAPP